MKELVERLLEKVEYFEPKDLYWQHLKEQVQIELDRKDTADNQYLWACIKLIACYMEDYVG